MTSTMRFDQWQNSLGQSYGTILQVQHTKVAAAPNVAGSFFSTSSTSLVSTGMSVSITPKFANSKLLILTSINYNQQGGPSAKGVNFQIWRDGVNTTSGGNINSAAFVYDGNNQDQYAMATANILLDANSTASTTFTLYCSIYSAGTVRISGHDGQSSITVMEIAQ